MQLRYSVFHPKVARVGLCPVVLLHSMIEDRKTWSKIAPQIADGTGRVVYTPDFRNHGESPWSDEYSIDILADDLDKFLMEHGLSRIVLVGHSVGGKTAIKYTLMKPKTVEKLILEDASAASVSVQGVVPLKTGMDLMRSTETNAPIGLDKELLVQIIRDVARSCNGILRVPEEAIQNYDYNLFPMDWTTRAMKLQLNLETILNALTQNKMRMNLSGTYDGDVLFLYGKISQFMGQTGTTEINKYFPRIKKIPFENTGHFIHHHHPADFTKQVIDFINDSPGTVQSKAKL